MTPLDGLAHRPLRPIWLCRLDANPWPCGEAKLVLLAAFADDRPGLLALLSTLQREAEDHLTQLDSGRSTTSPTVSCPGLDHPTAECRPRLSGRPSRGPPAGGAARWGHERTGTGAGAAGPGLAEHRWPGAHSSPTCAARSCCSTSGPSAASTACTCSTSCGRWRRSTATCSSSIGVHSPKFEHEKDPAALAAAVERYGVHHPVLDDPELDMWQQYAAKAWPTLAVIDPEGYVVATMAGEGHAEGLTRLIDELIADPRGEGHPAPRATARTCRRRSRDDRAALPRQGPRARRTATCWSPTRPTTRWSSSTPTARRWSAGSAPGERGRADGRPTRPSSPSRRGCACCRRTWPRSPATTWSSPTPSTTCCAGLRLDTGEVTTVAGTGRQWRATVDFDQRTTRSPSTCPRRGTWPGTTTGSSSRWPASTSCGGSTRCSAPPASTPAPPSRRCATARWTEVWMAQPSGLSVSRRRHAAVDRRQRVLRAALRRGRRCCTPPSGRACSTSGTWTARPTQALLQHPLGVLRAARRLGAGRRHLQRRGPPLRPGHRRGVHGGRPGWPSRATWCSPPDGDGAGGRVRPRTG